MLSVLNKRCNVRRPILTNGPLGESRTFPDAFHLEDVPCAFQQRSGQQSSAKELSEASGGQSSLVAIHRIWFETGTDILSSDQIELDGVTYEVETVDPDVGGVGHHGHADVREIRG